MSSAVVVHSLIVVPPLLSKMTTGMATTTRGPANHVSTNSHRHGYSVLTTNRRLNRDLRDIARGVGLAVTASREEELRLT